MFRIENLFSLTLSFTQYSAHRNKQIRENGNIKNVKALNGGEK